MIRFRKDTPRYWFMSNYYSCEFVMNGIRYKNAEAAFQSHKVLLCGNMLMGPRGFRSMNCRSIDEAFCLVCGVHGGKNW